VTDDSLLNVVMFVHKCQQQESRALFYSSRPSYVNGNAANKS